MGHRHTDASARRERRLVRGALLITLAVGLTTTTGEAYAMAPPADATVDESTTDDEPPTSAPAPSEQPTPGEQPPPEGDQTPPDGGGDAQAEANPVVPPRPRELPPVPYPDDASAGEVSVTLAIVVDENGEVNAARVLDKAPSSVSERFDAAAVEYVKALTFEAAMYEGQALAVEIEFVVSFQPPDAAGQPAAVAPASSADTDEDSPPQPTPPNSASASSKDDDGDERDPDGSPDAELDPDLDLEVEGVRSRIPEQAAGDFDMEVGRLADVPRNSAEDMLTLAPGLMLSNAGGEGHPSGIFLRGFDAQEGQDLEILVAGVPINEVSQPHGHGMADTNFVIPELVHTLRVIEGPFDARQGDFAVAGTAEYRLGLDYRGVMLKGGYGRFNERRALLAWGPASMGRGTFAAFEVRGGDGFGPNRSHRSVRFMGGFDRKLPKDYRVSANVALHVAQWLQAGVVREDDFEARRNPNCPSDADSQFFCFYDPNQGGFTSRVTASLQLARERTRGDFAGSLFFTRRHSRIFENFTGFTQDVRPDGAPPRGDGLEQPYNVTTVGSRGHWATQTTWGKLRQAFEVGYALRYDDGRSTLRRLRREDNVPYDRVFDHAFSVFNPAVYADAVFRPWWRLDWRVGLRTDVFAYRLRDYDQPEMDREGAREPYDAREAFGVSVQPRTAVTLSLTPWLDTVLAYGIGSRSSDAAALSDGEVAPFARAQSTELGLRSRNTFLDDRLVLETRGIGFYTHVDQDLVFDETRGRNVLVGESNRFGALAFARVGMPEWFDLQGSFTWSEAYLPPSAAGPFDWTAGPRLPYIPRFVGRADASVFHDFQIRTEPFAWNVAMGLSAISARPLPLNQFGDGWAVVDAAARLRWRWLELGVEATNLFDVRYRQVELYYASNFESAERRPSLLPVTHFVAGPPLQVMGTLAILLEARSFERARDDWSARRRARRQTRRE